MNSIDSQSLMDAIDRRFSNCHRFTSEILQMTRFVEGGTNPQDAAAIQKLGEELEPIVFEMLVVARYKAEEFLKEVANVEDLVVPESDRSSVGVSEQSTVSVLTADSENTVPNAEGCTAT